MCLRIVGTAMTMTKDCFITLYEHNKYMFINWFVHDIITSNGLNIIRTYISNTNKSVK